MSSQHPEMKQQSKQKLNKGLSGPFKAKMHVTKSKQLVLTFCCSKGLIYTTSIPRGPMVYTNHMVVFVGKFMKIFMQKLFITAAGRRFFHWPIAEGLPAADVTSLPAARRYQKYEQWLFFTDIATLIPLHLLECKKRHV
jgi:hypothetical protein